LKNKLNQTKKQIKDQMEWLVNILHVDPPSLQEFIEGLEINIGLIDNTIKKISKNKKENEKLNFKEILEEIYRAVHTIKGNASLIDIQYFCNETHEFENDINTLKNKKGIERKDLIPIVTHLRNLQRAMTKIKGLIEKIDHFYKNFRPKREYEGELLIKSLKNLVINLNERTNKNVQIIHKDFDPVEIPYQYRLTVKDILIQLVNNAIYHGIETSEERIKNNKEPVGQIEIESTNKGKEFCIRFRDDGQGLDLEKIRLRAKNIGKWKKEEIDSWKDSEISGLIFEPGITTSEKEEMIAGRGVGMDLVKKKIDKHEGRIEIKFEKQKFCEFNISLPV
jgi:Amt family ammonium transporter